MRVNLEELVDPICRCFSKLTSVLMTTNLLALVPQSFEDVLVK
jgi:hypothetical protein